MLTVSASRPSAVHANRGPGVHVTEAQDLPSIPSASDVPLAEEPPAAATPAEPGPVATAPPPPAMLTKYTLASPQIQGSTLTVRLVAEIPTGTIWDNQDIRDEKRRNDTAVAKARQAIGDVRAAFLTTAAVKDLNALRARCNQAGDNLRTAQAAAQAARTARSQALADGRDGDLDAIDAKLATAEADVARFKVRSDELHRMVTSAEKAAKAELTRQIGTAIEKHVAETLAARPLAEQRLAEAVTPAVHALLQAEADFATACRFRDHALAEFLTV
jgi:hypothetical protein